MQFGVLIRFWHPPAPMGDLDLKLLRWMRTHGHTPAIEDAAVAFGKTGNNALVWFLLGAALAIIDNGRWESWLICALLGPLAIGLNYAIKLAVRRPRPLLEGLPPLGGAPARSASPPPTRPRRSRWRRRCAGSTRRPRRRSSSRSPSRSAVPTSACTTRPTSSPAPSSASSSA